MVSAFVLANELISDATPVNAGIPEHIWINEAAHAIFDYMGWEPQDIDYMTDKPIGVRHRVADTTRAEVLLGWQSEYMLLEGLEETIDWNVENRDRANVEENLGSLLHER